MSTKHESPSVYLVLDDGETFGGINGSIQLHSAASSTAFSEGEEPNDRRPLALISIGRLMNSLCKHYHSLPSEVRALIPMRFLPQFVAEPLPANTDSTHEQVWRLWLAFYAGRLVSTPHGMTSGRDALRELRARFDQMGVPVEHWAPIESAALENSSAISLGVDRVARRVIQHLAGPTPIGPLDRIKD